ncbi:MAG: response regulator [Proteobacteria bacterium]|nr:response regulator [Pseudomonadota bacterium]
MVAPRARPYLRAMDAPDRAGSPATAAPAAVVFVVDDDEAVRDSLQLLLQSEGFEVVGFASCAAALAAIDAARPTCLLLDLHLPGAGGLELLAMLAARDIRVPVVMITGRIDRETRLRALASGADAVLEKPLDHAALVGAIERVRRAVAPA